MKELLKLTKEHIILDYIDTWPNSILNIIQENIYVIENYLKTEEEIDEKANEDIFLRRNIPQNEFKNTYYDLIHKIQLELKNKLFIGFHCTKITDFENEDIKENGLKPLRKSFLDERLLKLKEKKLINENTYLYLKKNNLSKEMYRKDRVFCFHCISTLKDHWGLSRLFKFWGGEALYREYEEKKLIRDNVLSIGKPSIILCSIREKDINRYDDIPERMIKFFLDPDTNCDFDNWLKKEVKVLNIINSKDKIFETLTNFSTWDK